MKDQYDGKRWKEVVENDIQMLERNVSVDLALNREE